ncbi:MAG: hypothetical protein ACYTDW_07390, partial [Planctomycetota bacterium]
PVDIVRGTCHKHHLQTLSFFDNTRIVNRHQQKIKPKIPNQRAINSILLMQRRTAIKTYILL